MDPTTALPRSGTTDLAGDFSVSSVTSSSGHGIVRVLGTVTADAAAHLADVLQLLLNAAQPVITVDLSQAVLVDPAALLALRLAYHEQHRAGRRLLITGDTKRLVQTLGLPADCTPHTKP